MRSAARFVGVLYRANSIYELKRGLSVGQCAEFVLSIVWGILVTLRLAGDDETVGEPAARALVKVVREWRAS